MTDTAYLAPNGKFYVFTKCGLPAVGGFMVTEDAVTGAPKNTYSDPSMTIINPPRMRIGSDGAVEFTLFWDTSESFYNYRTYDATGTLIDEQVNYPVTGTTGESPDITVVLGSENFAQNEQYAFWNRGITFDDDTLPIGSTETADMWFFTRGNINAQLTISKFVLPVGYSGVPFSPTNAYRYQVTTPSPDSINDHGQRYQDVNTLSNKIVFRGNYMATNNIGSTATVSLYCLQNFGTGGSTEVVTIVNSFTVNDTPEFYSASFTVPSVSTKVVGAGSFVEIGWRFNPAQIQDVLLMDEQLQKGTGTGIIYPYETQNLQYNKILPDVLAGYSPTEGTNIIGWANGETLYQFLIDFYTLSNTKEYLVGWAFKANPYQFGFTINTTVNGEYIADQTILLSDGNDVVSKNSNLGEILVLTVKTAAKKFGVFTIIESLKSFYLQDTAASMGARMAPSFGTARFGMAVIGWTGTAGLESRIAVSAFNAPGTDPSLATNWEYVSEILYFDQAASVNPTFQFLNNQPMGTFTSYGCLMWLDSADIAIGDSAFFLEGSLTNGERAKFNSYTDIAEVLREVQRYYYRNYNLGVATGTVTNTTAMGLNPVSKFGDLIVEMYVFPATSSGTPPDLNTSSMISWVPLPVEMYRNPSVQIYNPTLPSSGGTGYLYVDSSSAPISGSTAVSISTSSSNQQGFGVIIAHGLLGFSALTEIYYAPTVYFNFVANALLGV